MNNKQRITYALCGAVTLSLGASINAQESATQSLDASEKILLMETINVTSNKEVAEQDLASGDPEVDQILNLVDSQPLLSDNQTEELSGTETNDATAADLVDSLELEANTETNEKILETDEADTSAANRSKLQKIKSKLPSQQESEQKKPRVHDEVHVRH